mmetsp:Transcript_95663/g.285610  ORF Transcript_95663/g.285610 Transcript_95663/m.285610 type:complete len:200 (-) Transcript_95663:140-739(-)
MPHYMRGLGHEGQQRRRSLRRPRHQGQGQVCLPWCQRVRGRIRAPASCATFQRLAVISLGVLRLHWLPRLLDLVRGHLQRLLLGLLAAQEPPQAVQARQQSREEHRKPKAESGAGTGGCLGVLRPGQRAGRRRCGRGPGKHEADEADGVEALGEEGEADRDLGLQGSEIHARQAALHFRNRQAAQHQHKHLECEDLLRG